MNFNRRQWMQSVSIAGLAGGCAGCRFVPNSGRRQWVFMTERQEVSLGVKAFNQLTQETKASQNLPLVQLLNRVGQRIAVQTERSDFDWEFQLLASEAEIAVCFPGGKVAVCEGLLPRCRNEAGLAAVLSHEVGHALARHGSERWGADLVLKNPPNKMAAWLGKPQQTPEKQMLEAYGMSQDELPLIPYTPAQEKEADQLGIRLMARAGYDPNVAAEFWQRLNSINVDEPSELATMHPCDERRELELLASMGQAEQDYADCEEKLGRGQAIVTPQLRQPA